MGVLSIGIAEKALAVLLCFFSQHAPALHKELDGLFIRSDNARKSANLGCHVGHGGALIDAEFFDGFAGIFHHFGQSFAAADVIQAEQQKNEVFGADVGLALAPDDHFHRFRNLGTDIFGDPGIKNVSGADAEGHAAHRAHMRRMRVRADIHLSGYGVAFGHHRMADSF